MAKLSIEEINLKSDLYGEKVWLKDKQLTVHGKTYCVFHCVYTSGKKNPLLSRFRSELVKDMFAAGTDTTFTLLEWAMTELLGHPDVLKTLQDEVRKVVQQKQLVDEDDLEKLLYVKAVLKETLRLHPPLPVLLFRQTSKDVKLQGYDIAANTQVIINAWAIHRDPTYWERPNEFWPDRFLNSSLEIKVPVLDFNLIPFGGGRRGCPGVPFALANAELALANLVYAFDWKLPDGAEGDASKLPEHPGVTVNRHDPLIAIANVHDTTCVSHIG